MTPTRTTVLTGTRRLALLTILVLMVAATAGTQPFPYGGQQVFSPHCILDPYLFPPAERCQPEPLLTTYGMRVAMGEVILGDADHELGFLIITNTEDVTQVFVAELYVKSRYSTQIYRHTLAPKEQYTIDLHSDPVFNGTGRQIVTASMVYFQLAGAAELKTYAYNAAHPDPLATVTTDKEGHELRRPTALPGPTLP